MKKIYSISVLLLIIHTGLYAQNTKIDPTLEVRRDYDAKILEIQKSKLSTEVADSIKKIDLDFTYSIFNKPIKELYEFKPLPSASIERSNRPLFPSFYLKAGLNYPIIGYADIYYQPNLPNKYALLLYASHNSFLGKSDINNNTPAKQLTTYGGINFTYSWRLGEIGIKTLMDHNFRTYYGFSPNEAIPFKITDSFVNNNLSHTYINTGASLFAKSVNPNPTHFSYSLEIGYNRLKDNGHLNSGFQGSIFEDSFEAELTIGPNFAKYHKLMVATNLEININENLHRQVNLTVNPYYSFTYNNWHLEIGGKLNRWWSAGDGGFKYFLKGSASIELIKNSLWFYGSLDGNNEMLTYRKLLKINPWITPKTKLQDIHTPLSLKTGIKGQILDRFSYNISAGYSSVSNQIFFELIRYGENPQLGNSFDAIYLKQKRLSICGEFLWQFKDLEIGAGFEYQKNRDNHKMTHYAPLTAHGYFKYSWRERIIFSGKALYRSSTDILPSFVKIDTEIEYAYNKRVSFFIRLNNILNANEIYYENYYLVGFNGGGGITFKF